MQGNEMGGMSMGSGVPSLDYMQATYWVVVGGAIGVATLTNILNNIIFRQRIFCRCSDTPAKPKNFILSTYATLTAIARESSNVAIPLALSRRLHLSSITLGRFSLVMAELVLVLVLCFYKLDPTDQWQWEHLGYRTGCIATAQLPLVVLLAGKNNIVGFLIGSSYERLSWLHRWVARILFLTVTIHMGFWFTDWARYDYVKVKLTTDSITQRGFAAWCILLWIVLSSFVTFRRWNYEFFVIQHLFSFVGLLAAIFLHLPTDQKAYIWIPIVLCIFDRTLRTLFVLYTNLSIFHPSTVGNGLWTCAATLEPLGCDTSRIIIDNPPISWRPGQHVFFSCHGIVPLQSHPFTIASIPSDNKMVFLAKSKAGATKRFFNCAEQCQSLPATDRDLRSNKTFTAAIDGPYGRMRPLQQFDSVFLIAGSSGGSFTVPLMRDIVASWRQALAISMPRRNLLWANEGTVSRYIRFVWVIKSSDHYAWFASQFAQVAEDIEHLRLGNQDVTIEMSIYITCDTNLEAEAAAVRKSTLPLFSEQAEKTPDILPTPDIDTANAKDISASSNDQTPTKEQITSKKTCGPNGTCCCATTIEDEDMVDKVESQPCCCCNDSPPPSTSHALPLCDSRANKKSTDQLSMPYSDTPNTLTLSPDERKAQPTSFHPSIAVLTGRPRPKTLIRKTLEQALGESAVVVCGPSGLVDDVRRSVVALGDERAVHKGTGAQGVYFWAEEFGY